jgi:hypothetical protein
MPVAGDNSQDDFKSRDVALTFHVGLAIRVSYLHDRQVPVASTSAELLPGSWRRWEQAFEAYDSGDEAENFQSVGVRLRECLVSFIGETTSVEMVSEGQEPPKASDFKGWVELLANTLAPGESSASLRSYLKKLSVETWTYVNWLTHAKNAVRTDAEIGLKMVEHLLGVFTAARLRLGQNNLRCRACGSYRLVGGTCEGCNWVDEEYEPPGKPRRRSRRQAKGECAPSSDISTFMRPEDVVEQEPAG